MSRFGWAPATAAHNVANWTATARYLEAELGRDLEAADRERVEVLLAETRQHLRVWTRRAGR